MNRAQDEGPSTPPGSGKKSGIRMGRAYQAAFEATVAVVVAGAAGGFADQRFDTAPMFLIVGVLLGVAVACCKGQAVGHLVEALCRVAVFTKVKPCLS